MGLLTVLATYAAASFGIRDMRTSVWK